MDGKGERESAAFESVKEWESIKQDLQGLPVNAAELLLDKLAEILNSLDLAPRDGVLSYAEIERGLFFQPLNYGNLDLALTRLLKRYYNLLKELSDDEFGPDSGISRRDLQVFHSVLDSALKSKACS